MITNLIGKVLQTIRNLKEERSLDKYAQQAIEAGYVTKVGPKKYLFSPAGQQYFIGITREYPQLWDLLTSLPEDLVPYASFLILISYLQHKAEGNDDVFFRKVEGQ